MNYKKIFAKICVLFLGLFFAVNNVLADMNCLCDNNQSATASGNNDSGCLAACASEYGVGYSGDARMLIDIVGGGSESNEQGGLLKGVETDKLEGFTQLAFNIANLILGLSGSVALLMFIYGGLMMIISGGSSQRVEKGRGALIAAVIGLFFVFAGYLIVKFVASSLGADPTKIGL